MDERNWPEKVFPPIGIVRRCAGPRWLHPGSPDPKGMSRWRGISACDIEIRPGGVALVALAEQLSPRYRARRESSGPLLGTRRAQ